MSKVMVVPGCGAHQSVYRAEARISGTYYLWILAEEDEEAAIWIAGPRVPVGHSLEHGVGGIAGESACAALRLK